MQSILNIEKIQSNDLDYMIRLLRYVSNHMDQYFIDKCFLQNRYFYNYNNKNNNLYEALMSLNNITILSDKRKIANLLNFILQFLFTYSNEIFEYYLLIYSHEMLKYQNLNIVDEMTKFDQGTLAKLNLFMNHFLPVEYHNETVLVRKYINLPEEGRKYIDNWVRTNIMFRNEFDSSVLKLDENITYLNLYTNKHLFEHLNIENFFIYVNTRTPMLSSSNILKCNRKSLKYAVKRNTEQQYAITFDLSLNKIYTRDIIIILLNTPLDEIDEGKRVQVILNSALIYN